MEERLISAACFTSSIQGGLCLIHEEHAKLITVLILSWLTTNRSF